jgi:hypothetical protein
MTSRPRWFYSTVILFSFTACLLAQTAKSVPFTGKSLEEIKPETTWLDLLTRSVELFPTNPRAAFQFRYAADLKARFDAKCDAANDAGSAYGALSTLRPEYMRPILWGKCSQNISASEHKVILEWARKSGPPALVNRLKKGCVPSEVWAEVLAGYEKFVNNDAAWAKHHEVSEPANLLKVFESQAGEGLDPGPSGDDGRKKLHALVVAFDLKGTDLGMQFVDMSDAMRVIVQEAVEQAGSTYEERKVRGEEIKFKRCRESAEKGDAKAQCDLGWCYQLGEGVKKDKAETIKWFRKSAEQGYARAQYSLGMIYCDYGQGKDTVEAVKLFRASAEQGDKNGLEMLAKCYDFGWGVPVDKVEAAKWYEKSRK